MNFPKDFVWGATTASYQIEGAVQEDGRGECIWHRFSHTPGKILNGDTGDVACDHYHRYPEDIALMKQLGLDGYRFSFAWARILPKGMGEVNQKGLDFYSKLLDELLAKDIQPYATLYHWDLPQALQDRGGWTNPDSVNWFADYTDILAQKLGDRLKHWITFNEPYCTSFLGYWLGVHAPGITDLRMAFSAAHHLLLAHGASVPVIRAAVPNSEVGITLNFTPSYPASDSEADIFAAQRDDALNNRWFIHPLYKGEYPTVLVDYFGDEWLGHIDLASVKGVQVPLDFLGVNYYTRSVIRHDDHAIPFHTIGVGNSEAEKTAMGWEMVPDAFRDLLLWIQQDYNPAKIHITENGSAFEDPEPVDGVVNDPKRVAYLESHLNAVAEAIQGGAKVEGYFAWSLLDNFEWAYGYSKRFGLVSINYETQERTLKQSALTYQKIIQDARA